MAAIMLIPYQGRYVSVHAIFPLAGLALLVLPHFVQKPIGIGGVVVALMAFVFTPLVIAAQVRSARKNKMAEGPFTYSFDDEGMHVTGVAVAQSIRWSAIPRVVIAKRFVYVFVGPAIAHSIPKAALKQQGVFDLVRSIVSRHTAVQ